MAIPRLLIPAVRLMDRMNFISKFTVVSVLFVVPFLILSGALIREIRATIATAEAERQGLLVMAQAYELMYRAAEFRDVAIIQRINASSGITDEVKNRHTQLQATLTHLQGFSNSEHSKHIESQLKKVISTWQKINDAGPGSAGGPTQHFQFYDEIVRDVEILINVVTYDSKLIHDPNLKTFVLINTMLKDIPRILESLGKARAYGNYALNLAAIDQETFETLNKIHEELINTRKTVAESLYFTLTAQGKDNEILLHEGTALLDDVDRATNDFYDRFITSPFINPNWQEYNQLISKAINKTHEFATTIIPIVDVQLQERINKEVIKLTLLLSSTTLMLLIITYLYSGIYYSIKRAIQSFSHNAQKVAAGDLSIKVGSENQDELKDLFFAFNKMVEQLRENQHQLIQAEKMASLGSMTAGIAHEMNTPIGTAITATTHLTGFNEEKDKVYRAGKITKQDFEEMILSNREALDIIRRNLERCAGLIRTFKQLNIYQQKKETALISIPEFLPRLNELLNIEKLGGKIRLQMQCEADANNGYDLDYLTLIFQHCLENAIEHGFPGQEGDIEITVQKSVDLITLNICDNGIGMNEEQVNHLFEPFYTLHRGDGHTGLGMHLVYIVITQALRGTIRCSSSPGKGTCLHISLPTG